MENAYGKPLPVPDPDSQLFWQGCKRHKLLLQRCADCGRYRYPPAPVCAHCRSRAAEWREASGRGRVYSWIVVHHPVPREVYAAEVPYVVALIELEEGVRIASNVVGCAADAVAADMPVSVTFEDVNETISLPKFRPA
jgi:uncharacterized OB-fold protein